MLERKLHLHFALTINVPLKNVELICKHNIIDKTIDNINDKNILRISKYGVVNF